MFASLAGLGGGRAPHLERARARLLLRFSPYHEPSPFLCAPAPAHVATTTNRRSDRRRARRSVAFHPRPACRCLVRQLALRHRHSQEAGRNGTVIKRASPIATRRDSTSLPLLATRPCRSHRPKRADYRHADYFTHAIARSMIHAARRPMLHIPPAELSTEHLYSSQQPHQRPCHQFCRIPPFHQQHTARSGPRPRLNKAWGWPLAARPSPHARRHRHGLANREGCAHRPR